MASASPHCLVCLGPVDSRAVSSIRRALILVVDDEESVRELIADVLVGHGYEVEMATDGADALRLCEQGRYDLILSDLRMPKMDGAAFYQALQAKYGPAMPRMIFVTGQAHSLDYAGFLGMTAVPVLAKPFTVDELRKAVTQALGTAG
jgi:two-component system cell cycle response regulator CpdR